MFAGKKSAQIREILISESAWEEMTCLFAPSPVYHRFNEFKLFNVVNSSEHPHTTFSSPYSNLREFKEFTEHGTAYINGRPDRTIRFCNVCILESKKKYGVGYLKKDWEFSRYCFKHKLPLSEIISCSYIKTVKAMSDIMQGGT